MGRVVARRRLAIVLASGLLIVGCASPTQSAAPSAAIAAPSEVAPTAAPTPTPTPTPTVIPTAAMTPEPTPTMAPTPRPVAAAWKGAPSQASVRDVQLQDVAWTGTRFVAVGWGAFLDSTDGVRWHRHKFAVGEASEARLAAGPVGVVAVGGTASWTSPDGLAWTAHPKAFRIGDVGSDTVEVKDIVATSGGWLAVGRQDPFCMFDCGSFPKRAWVWTSDDGVSWTRVPDQKAFKGGGMDAVARGQDGFIAVGAASGNAAIWTSPDGLVWTRVPDDPMFHGPDSFGGLLAGATGVAVHGGVAVVVGSVYAQDVCPPGYATKSCPGVRAWRSADWRTWSKASVEKAKDGQASTVDWTIDGFLATGGSTGCPGGIWASTDGQAWRCDSSVPAMKGFGPSAAAASDTVEVTVGLTDAGWDENGSDPMPGAVWYRTWS